MFEICWAGLAVLSQCFISLLFLDFFLTEYAFGFWNFLCCVYKCTRVFTLRKVKTCETRIYECRPKDFHRLLLLLLLLLSRSSSVRLWAIP